MWKTTLYRAVKAGAKNFIRNGWLSIATTSVIALTLFIISVLLSLILIANLVLEQIQDKISVSAYFETNTSEQMISKIKKDLESMDEVKRVDYTSRGDALGSLKERYHGNAIIMDSLKELKENPLEASLSIKVHDPSKYEIIENELVAGKYKDYVSKMDYSDHKGEIEKLNKIINSIRKTGAIMVLIFVIIAILVTFNSIRLTMYTYRTEVEIMKLVGASNWFIRLPFITEGVLYGVFAALVVGIIWYPLAHYFTPFFANAGIQIDTVQFLHQNIVYIVGIQLLIGVLLGVTSSFIAIRRYLKT
ncbi:MAG: permease-like cell division protein FtsX [Patescibacteria group bacterium]|nr:permease-like cell division protein FtsX [Patescibacteria group bacterium]